MEYALCFHLRGTAYYRKGQYRNAIEDDSESIRLRTDTPAAYNSLAWTLATCPVDDMRDGRRAVECARYACQLSWKPEFLDTLAAAYAEAGDFDEAIKWETKVLEAQPPAHLAARASERLELYQKHQPCREY